MKVTKVEINPEYSTFQGVGQQTALEKRVIFVSPEKIKELREKDEGIVGDLLREEEKQ